MRACDWLLLVFNVIIFLLTELHVSDVSMMRLQCLSELPALCHAPDCMPTRPATMTQSVHPAPRRSNRKRTASKRLQESNLVLVRPDAPQCAPAPLPAQHRASLSQTVSAIVEFVAAKDVTPASENVKKTKGRPRVRNDDPNWADIQMPAYKSGAAASSSAAAQRSPSHRTPVCSDDDSLSPHTSVPRWLKSHRKTGPAGVQSPPSDSDPGTLLPYSENTRTPRKVFRILDDSGSESSMGANSNGTKCVNEAAPKGSAESTREHFDNNTEMFAERASFEGSGDESLQSNRENDEMPYLGDDVGLPDNGEIEKLGLRTMGKQRPPSDGESDTGKSLEPSENEDPSPIEGDSDEELRESFEIENVMEPTEAQAATPIEEESDEESQSGLETEKHTEIIAVEEHAPDEDIDKQAHESSALDEDVNYESQRDPEHEPRRKKGGDEDFLVAGSGKPNELVRVEERGPGDECDDECRLNLEIDKSTNLTAPKPVEEGRGETREDSQLCLGPLDEVNETEEPVSYDESCNESEARETVSPNPVGAADAESGSSSSSSDSEAGDLMAVEEESTFDAFTSEKVNEALINDALTDICTIDDDNNDPSDELTEVREGDITLRKDIFDVITAEVWDETSAQAPTSVVNVEDVFEILSGNTQCWINPPDSYLSQFDPAFLEESELTLWRIDTNKPLRERRVMVWNKQIQKVAPFAESPTISDLLQFLRRTPDCDVLSSKNLEKVPTISQVKLTDCVDEQLINVTSKSQARADATQSAYGTQPSAAVAAAKICDRKADVAGQTRGKKSDIAPAYHREQPQIANNSKISDTLVKGASELSDEHRKVVAESNRARPRAVSKSGDKKADASTATGDKRTDFADETNAKLPKITVETIAVLSKGASTGEGPGKFISTSSEEQPGFPIKTGDKITDLITNKTCGQPVKALGTGDLGDKPCSPVSVEEAEAGESNSDEMHRKLRLSCKRPPHRRARVNLQVVDSTPTQGRDVCIEEEVIDGNSSDDILVAGKLKRRQVNGIHEKSPKRQKSVADAPATKASEALKDKNIVADLNFNSAQQSQEAEQETRVHFCQQHRAEMLAKKASIKLKLRVKPPIKKGSIPLRLRIRPISGVLGPKQGTPLSFMPRRGKRLASIVFHKIIGKLRHHGLDPLKDTQTDTQPEIWNLNTNSKLRPQRAPKSGRELLAFFCRTHRYEVYHGQDILRNIGRNDGMELVSISASAPAKLVMFWNKRRRKMESMEDGRRTVGEVLESEKNYVLYTGQDYPKGSVELKTLTRVAKLQTEKGLGIITRHVSLLCRGEKVSDVIEAGWKPVVIFADKFPAVHAVYWDINHGRLRVLAQQNQRSRKSVKEFLAEREGVYELYTGQDFDRSTKVELKFWFEILKWAPGCRGDDMACHLSGVDSAKRSIQRRSASFVKNRLPKTSRKRTKKDVHRYEQQHTLIDDGNTQQERDELILKDLFSEDTTEVTKSKDSVNGSSKRKDIAIGRNKSREPKDVQMRSKDVSIAHDHGKESACVVVRPRERQAKPKYYRNGEEIPTEEFMGFTLSSDRVKELRELSATDIVTVHHVKSSTPLTHSQSPKLRSLEVFISENPGYAVYDRYLFPIDMDNLEEALANDKVHLRANLAAERLANRLRNQVTDILKRTRLGDDLENVRQELEEELAVCDNFEQTLKDLRTGGNVKLASKFLDILERLDVYSLFTDKEDDFLVGPPDLLSIREKFEIGDFFLVHDVMQEFRQVCGANLQYLQADRVMHEEAVNIFMEGEHHFSYFFDTHLTPMRRDRTLFRIRQICDRACELVELAKCTGVRMGLKLTDKNGDKHNNSDNSILSEMGEVRDLSLNLSSELMFKRNAFMNSRDPIGNSIMSNYMSNRVLGFIIDSSSDAIKCVASRESWNVDSKCHLCQKRVEEPYTNALVCANRIFNECRRIVCRGCLQSQSKIAMDLNTFKQVRNEGTWHCVHCTGFCKRTKRACLRGEEPTKQLQRRSVTFSMDFTFVDWEDESSIFARFARRARNGKYEPFEHLEHVEGLLERVDGFMNWKCATKLSTGTYRVCVDIDGKPRFESNLYVFPKDQLNRMRLSENGHVGMDYVKQNKAHEDKTINRPVVHWEAGESMGSGAAASLRCTPIRDCSRTEGYNWSWSKRHSLMRYRPRVTGEVPVQSPTISGTNHTPYVPDNVRVFGVGPRSNHFRDMLCNNNISYKQYQMAVNADRYDHMMKYSLWSLVVARSKIHGSGLFTISGYGTGDYIIEYAGDLIRSPLGDIREPRYVAKGVGVYMFRVNEHYIVDATVKSNRSRFVNHCCDPNMSSEVVHVRGRDLIILKASRPIPPFTELTFDYMLPIEEKKLRCLCRGMGCTGIMN